MKRTSRTETPRVSEAALLIFVEQAPVPVAMFDRRMVYLAASRRWIADFSAGQRDVIGRSHYEVVPEIADRWKDIHKRALAGETFREEEDSYRRSDGRIRWISWEARPWHHAGGEIGGIIVYADDITSKVEAQRALHETNARLAAETQALARLNQASSRLWHTRSIREGLEEMLTATIELLGADMGNIQLLDAGRNVLRIAAHRGFGADFLEFFREVSAEDGTACGRALRTGKAVLIEDVERDAPFKPFRSVARAAGYRAVVSAPMLGHHGTALGMISTHFRSPHRPSDPELQRLDLYLHRAAGFIERCNSEEALRQSEERTRLAVEAGCMAMWDWDMATNEVKWNQEQYRMLGYGIGEIEPSYAAWATRIHPEDRAATEAALSAAMLEHTAFTHSFRLLHPDGSVRWCSPRGRFIYDPEGNPTRMIGLVEDVTEARQAEETQRVLVAELQHRTRNLIAVVQAIAQQTIGTAETLDSFSTRFNTRLCALSRVQSLLSRSDKDPIVIGALVGMELEALGVEVGGGRVTLEGPAVRLRKSAVQMFALAIHELATNARKYGALATEDGRLSVTWRFDRGEDGNRCLALEWSEERTIPTGEHCHPRRSGYGRKLIEQALPYSLSARTTFELGDRRLRCSIILPLGPDGDEEVVG